MDKTNIFGVKLGKRIDTAPKFQEIITKFGCNINTRIGLHHADGKSCPMGGVILLDLVGDEEDINKLEDELRTLQDIEIQKMCFIHD